MFSDEGGLLIGGHALNPENGLKTLARLCKLWDGAPYDRVRGGDGSGILYDRRLALHQLAQPEVMATLLSDRVANGQGFLARCLVAAPESTIGTRIIERYERAAERPDMKRLFARLKELFETKPRTKDERGQELDPRPLGLSADAVPLAIAASNRFEELMRAGNELHELRDRASKAMDNAVRIAAILTVMDHGLTAYQIDRKTFERALVLVQWYLAEALRLRGVAVVPKAVLDAEALLEWLKEHQLRVFRSANVLTRGPAQLRNKPRFDAAVARLVTAGYLAAAPQGTVVDDVKPKVAWEVHPGVF
jgi:putative DNA primase/helicase